MRRSVLGLGCWWVGERSTAYLTLSAAGTREEMMFVQANALEKCGL